MDQLKGKSKEKKSCTSNVKIPFSSYNFSQDSESYLAKINKAES